MAAAIRAGNSRGQSAPGQTRARRHAREAANNARRRPPAYQNGGRTRSRQSRSPRKCVGGGQGQDDRRHPLMRRFLFSRYGNPKLPGMELHKGSAAALRNPKTIRVICIFVLLLLVAAVFGRAAGHEFVNLDDDKFLFNNAYYLPPTFHGLARLWSAPHAHLYTPVTMTVWWFIAQVATLHNDTGATLLNPWIFHAASLAVSLANVLLVWQLLRRVVRSDFAAMLGAAVFAIHPFQVETLAWASEMKDLLAAMFSLLALLALLPVAQSDSATIAGRKGLLITALLCFIAAMLSK